MKKRITKILGLGLVFVSLASTIVFGANTKYLNPDTEIDTNNIEFNLSESVPCESIYPDENSNDETIAQFSGELGDVILVSTGWQEHTWKSTMNTIKIHAQNNGAQKVYCEIVKSDGTYLGAGRNFTLRPGETHTFTRYAGPGEYKIYVYNSDGSKLNVFVSAR